MAFNFTLKYILYLKYHINILTLQNSIDAIIMPSFLHARIKIKKEREKVPVPEILIFRLKLLS
jgi:hypothetical protein